MSKKPVSYEFHPSMFQTTEEYIKRSVGRAFKGTKRRELIQDISRSEPNFFTSLNFVIFAEDLFFERSDRQVIIPEGPEIYQELLKAKYSMSSAEGFSLPFSSFVLCMPTGFEVEGVTLPPCLVNYGNYESSAERLIYPFVDYLQAPRPKVNLELASPGANALSITYKEIGTHAYSRVLAVDDDLPAIFSAETPQACREAIGDYGFFDRMVKMDEKDIIIQFYLMKLVSSIGIYLLANQQQGLKQGFPGKTMPKLVNRDPGFAIRMNTLLNKPPMVNTPEDNTATRWHFSQTERPGYPESNQKEIKLGWLWD